MGKYSDWAKSQSKYLTIAPGETVEVEWTGNSVLSRGQYGEGFDFDFLTADGKKILTIRNGKIVSQFDDYVKGEILNIKRSEKDEKGQTKLSIWRKGDIPF